MYTFECIRCLVISSTVLLEVKTVVNQLHVFFFFLLKIFRFFPLKRSSFLMKYVYVFDKEFNQLIEEDRSFLKTPLRKLQFTIAVCSLMA